MHFHEAREKFRELEGKFFSGELAEGDFLDQVAQLRVIDAEGREWIISARNGRWLVHDGRQWVFAEPPQEGETLAAAAREPRREPVVPPEPRPKPKPKPQPKPKPRAKPKRAAKAAPPRARVPRQAPAHTPSPAVAEEARRKPVTWPRLRIPFRTTRVLSGTLSALLVVACIAAVGVSAWVLFLRDLGEPDSVSLSGESSSMAPVETYTPRPATPTYTPTATPTPSRTSTPTITPPATNTSRPTPTPTATETAPPTAPATATAPAPPTARTYTVAAGDTLSEIAARFGVSTDALARANGISDPALIRDGQVLVIPSASATPTWTPIVLAVVSRTTTATATPSPTVTRTSRTPTATVTATGTRRPTKTPKPAVTATAKATSTPKPVALSGKIAFTVWNTALGKYELYVSRIDGSGRNLLGQGYRQPQFRQDGNMLAVNGDGKPNFEHLVRMDSNGGGVVEISNFSEDAFPTWSPDGNIVAYSSLAWGDGQSRLGIVHDIFGKNQNWIRIGTTEIRGEYPFWMPDGRVVYHGCAFLTDHAACGLFWVGAGGGDYHRVTTDSSDTAPAGFGSRVTFMSLRDGDWDVYTVNMDGSGLKRLTDNSAQDGLPTWSPDGKSIAFVSDRSGAWAIWAMDANGGNQRKLFDLGGGFGSGDYDWLHERISWAP